MRISAQASWSTVALEGRGRLQIGPAPTHPSAYFCSGQKLCTEMAQSTALEKESTNREKSAPLSPAAVHSFCPRSGQMLGFSADLISCRESCGQGIWRRERDSNPRDGYPPTHFPGVRLRPLGHLSATDRKTCGSALEGSGPVAGGAL